MKRAILILLSIVLSLTANAQSYQLSGTVLDENQQPLSFVNVYIDGTLDGTSTNNEGKFIFETTEAGTVILMVSFIGYQTYSVTKKSNELKDIQVILKPAAELLQDVVIVAGNYALKSSTLESQQAVNLVTMAGSGGDLYQSIAMLPGSQASGIDGRLLVRGGSDRESQTFIDGMHVLAPYTANAPNSGTRSKYSPFHFEGINFSTGGYSPEYSQSLSSILPLDTQDKSRASKYGMGLMNVNVEAGGSKAWEKGSASVTATYTDLSFYNATLYPGENDQWDIPYRDFSMQKQLRFNFDTNTTLKTYYGYSKTRFRRWWEDDFADNLRNMNYNEDNLYLNTTFKKKRANNVHYFAGAAYSLNKKAIANSRIPGDTFNADEQEIHLKSKASKRFGNLYKLELGAETYLKSYDMKYSNGQTVRGKIDNNITGVFVSNDFNFTPKFFVNLSGRAEYSSLTDNYAILPRLAVNYQIDDIILSGIIGKYQQSTDNNYLLYDKHLSMEDNLMTMLGLYYTQSKRIYRAEVYNKRYDNLPLLIDNCYTSDGYGYSRGIDLYFDDRELFRNFEYMAAYSYNDSKRKYLYYPEKVAPDFTTRHNASLALKYNWFRKKTLTIFGITNRLASGRPYHNPNKEGFMNSTTSPYHTLDVSLTVLPHPKVVVYASFSNVLNRKNIYGYSFSDTPDANGTFAALPTTKQQRQAFYIGVFITLGKNVAYEASHF